LGRLVRRRAGRERAEFEAVFAQAEEPLRVRFASNTRREVLVHTGAVHDRAGVCGPLPEPPAGI